MCKCFISQKAPVVKSSTQHRGGREALPAPKSPSKSCPLATGAALAPSCKDFSLNESRDGIRLSENMTHFRGLFSVMLYRINLIACLVRLTQKDLLLYGVNGKSFRVAFLSGFWLF